VAPDTPIRRFFDPVYTPLPLSPHRFAALPSTRGSTNAPAGTSAFFHCQRNLMNPPRDRTIARVAGIGDRAGMPPYRTMRSISNGAHNTSKIRRYEERFTFSQATARFGQGCSPQST